MTFTTEKLIANNQKIEMTKFSTLEEWLDIQHQEYEEYLNEKLSFNLKNLLFNIVNYILVKGNAIVREKKPTKQNLIYLTNHDGTDPVKTLRILIADFKNNPNTIAGYHRDNNMFIFSKTYISNVTKASLLSTFVHELIHFYDDNNITPTISNLFYFNTFLKTLNSVNSKFNFQLNYKKFIDMWNTLSNVTYYNILDYTTQDVYAHLNNNYKSYYELKGEIRAYVGSDIYMKNLGYKKIY